MYSYKYELLQLLDDPEVREKILSIRDERAEKISPDTPQNFRRGIYSRREESSTPVERNSYASENFLRRNDEVQRLKEQLRLTESELEKLRAENSRLNNSLTQTQQRETKFKRDADTWKNSYDNANRQAETYRQQLDDAQKKISRLETSVDELKTRLRDGFARGQELFQKYQRVGAHARQILGTSVFVRNDFTSFICGGAQTGSLEKIWDVLKSCVMSGNQHDAEILWEIFEYCLELVNASRIGKGFSILSVNVGDRFDSDIHSEGGAGRAQGKISVVCLPGFQNDYNGNIIRKSIVQVG